MALGHPIQKTQVIRRIFDGTLPVTRAENHEHGPSQTTIVAKRSVQDSNGSTVIALILKVAVMHGIVYSDSTHLD